MKTIYLIMLATILFVVWNTVMAEVVIIYSPTTGTAEPVVIIGDDND